MNIASYGKHFIARAAARYGIEIRRQRFLDSFILQFNSQNINSLLYLSRMVNAVSKLNGAVVECGVGEARTLQMLALLLHEEKKGRELWGFDSFEGFPEPSAYDRSPRNPQKGQLNYMRKEDAEALIYDLCLGIKVNIVKGFFEDTLPRTSIPPIALLHLDVDLYQSYKTCLENLFPKVVYGGIVMFDEYKNPDDIRKWPGAVKAVDEYFSNMNYKFQTDSGSGKYFLVKA